MYFAPVIGVREGDRTEGSSPTWTVTLLHLQLRCPDLSLHLIVLPSHSGPQAYRQMTDWSPGPETFAGRYHGSSVRRRRGHRRGVVSRYMYMHVSWLQGGVKGRGKGVGGMATCMLL